ncbi:MAG: ethyl tert-butyl ether degradation EthD [Deltaproteobacteria bacterium]|nr:ethyl tert-butyl ether degradation EthD [Deltaproteobacteria bacterium]
MTLKALALMPRRLDLTREQFRRYYETHHTPLALRFFSFRKYVRNHLLDAPDIGFDCVSEFWPRRVEATFALMQTKVGERMREDERQFTDQPRIVSGACEETQLAGAPRSDDETGVTKLALLLRTPLDAATLVGSLRAWAAGTAAPGRRVALDSLIGMPHAAFPCDAILWLHAVDADGDPRLPAGIEVVGRARTQAEETPTAVLEVAGTEMLA